MCGIFALFNNDVFTKAEILLHFQKGKARGPEATNVLHFDVEKLFLGFHRLAINGLDEISNQPICINNTYLICNGEIYNHTQLCRDLKIDSQTCSDCEVILHLYFRYGIAHTLTLLDGVFAFVLLDMNISKAFVARDPMGVRPLYQCVGPGNISLFASEMKSIHGLFSILQQVRDGSSDGFIDGHTDDSAYRIEPFLPGSYSVLDTQTHRLITRNQAYFLLPPPLNMAFYGHISVFQTLRYLFISAVQKRIDSTERPIAALLSGGLDSSLVAALASRSMLHKHNTRLETYSIGLADSEDVRNARIVARFLDTKHHEIIVTEDDFFAAIPDVIYHIESYDTTTVRASIGNYLVAKYIAEHSEAKVILNGDGSDELFGGYLYMQMCPDSYEFERETRRLLQDIHLFDVLRSDKCISSNGLEPRTPFLDKSLVQFYMSLPRETKYAIHRKGGKYSIRQAFADMSPPVLPEEILWRRKEAFSDGVSSLKKSLFTILQEKIEASGVVPGAVGLSGVELEKAYYKQIFDGYYKGAGNVVPYFWMPKYSKTNDPSARTIENY